VENCMVRSLHACAGSKIYARGPTSTPPLIPPPPSRPPRDKGRGGGVGGYAYGVLIVENCTPPLR